MKTDDDDLRRRYLEEAVELRLSEVRSRAGLQGVADRNAPHGVRCDDPEETLRVLMVRLWPRVTGGIATPEDLSDLFEHLGALSQLAGGADLRFLDAWNNAYEALGTSAHEEFLSEYAQILEVQLDRIRTT